MLKDLIESTSDLDAARVLATCHGLLSKPEARALIIRAVGHAETIVGAMPKTHDMARKAEDVYSDLGQLVALMVIRELTHHAEKMKGLTHARDD